MKKVYLFCIIGIITSLMMTSCQPGQTSATEKDTINIVLARVGGDPFYKTVECGAIEEAKKLGANLEIQSMANFEIAEQTRVIDAIIATKPDVLITAPVDAVGVAPAIQKAKDAGIKVVTFDTRLENFSIVDAEVITDNFAQGKLAAETLAKVVGEKGKVMVLSDMPGIYTTGEEQRGFEEQIKNYANINYLGTEYHNNDQNRAVQIIKAKLVSDPDLAGIFATNTFGSLAVATALREAAMVGKIKVVAYDTPQEIIDGLKEGVFDAVLAYEAKKEGTLAVQAAVALAKGETPEKLTYVGNIMLTKDNVDNSEYAYLRYVNECQ
ncbi:MAG: substrate-binding domain-containing protein [Anaerolineae bacterium]|nr:substrate-binding domain-containing protein [Anaerolineae bacterium]